MQSHTRNKRDVEPPESAFYKMDAFGSTLHLKLKRNDNLLAPGMTVIRRNRDGTITLNEVSNRMRPSYKMQILVVQHLVYSWCDFAWKTTTSLPIHWIGTGE